MDDGVSRRAMLRAVSAALGTTTVTSRAAAGGDYERTYDPVEDPAVNVGAVYIPFLGGRWEECASTAEPSVGRYSMSDSDAVNRHVDQMQGFGVSTLMFNFSVLDDVKYLERFREADLTAEMPVECFHNLSNALKWRGNRTVREQIDAHVEYLREAFLRRENASTHDGRPVVTFWDVDYLAWGGNEQSREVKRAILDEWDGFEAFVAYLRSKLTVDGTNPYLVGDFHNNAIGGYSADARELNRGFDAATTWTGRTPAGEKLAWADARSHVERNFAATRAFTDEHGMDFVPTVFPGFDDRHNDCFGGDKHVPRDPSQLRDLFALADEYRTTDRVNLASFNDWSEGHQIEPGSFQGRDYGTAYLEVVKEYVEEPGTATTPTSTTTTTASSTTISTTRTTTRDTAADTPTTTSDGQPGFGAASAGVAAGLGTYLLHSRQTGGE